MEMNKVSELEKRELDILLEMQIIKEIKNTNYLIQKGERNKRKISIPSTVLTQNKNTKTHETWDVYEMTDATFIVTKEGNLYVIKIDRESESKMEQNLQPKRLEIDMEKGENIKNIYSSYGSTFIETTGGSIFAFGNNEEGQLGIAMSDQFIYTPTRVKITFQKGETITAMHSNWKSSFIATSKNKLYSFGWNDKGQIGLDSSIKKRNIPTQISIYLKNGEYVASIYTKWKSTFMVTTQSRVYTFGLNDEGQLGIDSPEYVIREPTIIPLKLKKNERIVSIETNKSSSFILTTCALYAFGLNDEGQLGIDNHDMYVYIPTLIAVNLEKEEFINSVYIEDYSTFITTTQSGLYSFGNNETGQLGVNSNIPKIYEPQRVPLKLKKGETLQSIATFSESTFIRTTYSRLFATGKNDKGQLGIASVDQICIVPNKVDILLQHGETIKSIDSNSGTTTIETNFSRIFYFGTLNLS